MATESVLKRMAFCIILNCHDRKKEYFLPLHEIHFCRTGKCQHTHTCCFISKIYFSIHLNARKKKYPFTCVAHNLMKPAGNLKHQLCVYGQRARSLQIRERRLMENNRSISRNLCMPPAAGCMYCKISPPWQRARHGKHHRQTEQHVTLPVTSHQLTEPRHMK